MGGVISGRSLQDEQHFIHLLSQHGSLTEDEKKLVIVSTQKLVMSFMHEFSIALRTNILLSSPYISTSLPCALPSPEATSPELSPVETAQLRSSPTAKLIVKQGWLMKRGAKVKSWKMRWFVAHNAQRNYEICYFKRKERNYVSEELLKQKGTMALFGGYTVRRFTLQEEKR